MHNTPPTICCRNLIAIYNICTGSQVFFNKFLVVERLQGVSRLIIWFLLKGVLESTCFRAFLEKNEVVSS